MTKTNNIRQHVDLMLPKMKQKSSSFGATLLRLYEVRVTHKHPHTYIHMSAHPLIHTNAQVVIPVYETFSLHLKLSRYVNVALTPLLR